MPARTHSSQSADLVTGGGASPANVPAACLHNGERWDGSLGRLWAIAGWSRLGIGSDDRPRRSLPPGGRTWQPLAPAARLSCLWPTNRRSKQWNEKTNPRLQNRPAGLPPNRRSPGGKRTGPYTIVGLVRQSSGTILFKIKSATREQLAHESELKLVLMRSRKASG
jgi:hypothetical protein